MGASSPAHKALPGGAPANPKRRGAAAGGSIPVRPSRGTVRALKILLVASLAVPTLLFALAAWQNRQVLLDESIVRAQRTSAILEQQASATFQLYEQIFKRTEERLQAGGAADPRALQTYLAKLDEGLDQIESIFVIDAEGRFVGHSRAWPMPAILSVADRDYFHALRDGATLAVGEPIVGRITGKRILVIAHRRTLPDGAFAGLIGISVSQRYFENFHRTLQASPTDAQTLLRDDGVFLARSPVAPNAPRAVPPAIFKRAIATAGTGFDRLVSPADHIDRIYAYRKLAGYPVYVAYGLNMTEVMGRWQRNSIRYGAIAGPGALALFTVTWIALLRARREETAARRLEEEMRQREAAEGALRQAQKMEAVGQLTGGMAHDFNNLLAVVATNIELAASLSENETARHRLDIGLKAIEGGQHLTQRLLAFSRRRPLMTVTADLRQKLPELQELIGPSIGRNVSLRVEVAPDAWPVEIDDGELQVAILNLVVNARDAMPDGGAIRISARNVSLPKEGRPPALQFLPGEVLAVAVADDGTGIPPEIAGRIFEPFFTTKGEGEGSGLGLAQVYGFAKQSNGAVTVESEVGRGTIFTLYLPRAAAVAAAAEPEAARSPAVPAAVGAGISPSNGKPIPNEKPRVLVVDDNAEVAEVAVASLEQLGYRVTVTDRPRKALMILAEDPRYDLVFSDIVMPGGMNGIELAAEVERRHPGLPVVLTTGYVQKERLAAAKGREILQKPYTIEALKTALERRLHATRPLEAARHA